MRFEGRITAAYALRFKSLHFIDCHNVHAYPARHYLGPAQVHRQHHPLAPLVCFTELLAEFTRDHHAVGDTLPTAARKQTRVQTSN